VPLADAPRPTAQLSSTTRSLTDFPPRTVVVVEVVQELEQELRSVGSDRGPDAFEHARVDAERIVGGFQQVRPQGAD
jgi:hypothetical protein